MQKPKLVNWQELIKIDPVHFVQTENFFINEINDTRAVFQSKNEYELLPFTEDSPEVGIQIRKHVSNHLEIKLYSCNAVTASGERIAFNPEANESPLSKTYLPRGIVTPVVKAQRIEISYFLLTPMCVLPLASLSHTEPT